MPDRDRVQVVTVNPPVRAGPANYQLKTQNILIHIRLEEAHPFTMAPYPDREFSVRKFVVNTLRCTV